MNILISVLPFLLRLALVFQSPEVVAIESYSPNLIAFSEDIKSSTDHFDVFSSFPNLPQLARKLDTEEKEIEFFDLFKDSSFKTTAYYYLAETSLRHVDHRKVLNRTHLYDLFLSWKTHIS